MHTRFSTCRGIPVCEEGSDESLGQITKPLPNPETGKIEGFFVEVAGALGAETLFLASTDIARFATRVWISRSEMLSPPEDVVRLRRFLEHPRPIQGQPIRTEDGIRLGRCVDVQFDTQSFMMQWIFPKKFFRSGVPLPLSAILEVRKDAIIVRRTLSKEVPAASAIGPILDLPDAIKARVCVRGDV